MPRVTRWKIPCALKGRRRSDLFAGGAMGRFRCPFRARIRGLGPPRASVARLPQPWAEFPVPVGDNASQTVGCPPGSHLAPCDVAELPTTSGCTLRRTTSSAVPFPSGAVSSTRRPRASLHRQVQLTAPFAEPCIPKLLAIHGSDAANSGGSAEGSATFGCTASGTVQSGPTGPTVRKITEPG